MAESQLPSIVWQCLGFTLYVDIDDKRIPRIAEMVPKGCHRSSPSSAWFDTCGLPLSNVKAPGEGNTSTKTAKSLIGCCLAERLIYQSHSVAQDDGQQTLDIVTFDKKSGLEVTQHFIAFGAIPVIRTFASVKNLSEGPICVSQISSFVIGGLTACSKDWWNDYTISFSRNSWFRECMWHKMSLPDAGLDNFHLFELNEGHQSSLATFSVASRGSFSTGSHLPIGLLEHRKGEDTWLWQVETNGSWSWEIGDYRDSIYMAAGGPNANDHDWKLELPSGSSFTTVPVALCHIRDTSEHAFAAMTDYRRHIIHPHRDYDTLPIIFNDYMNCLMGDPTEDKICALIGAVARSGAEYFVIDAGWYADDSNWWDDVGLWQPSRKRFPSGFKSLMDKIRAAHLIPGLWLEPEVIGVRSEVAMQLPETAFFQQAGKRVVERGRFQLDYRHPSVRKRMHDIIESLVVEYGIGYFKFDYNIEVLSGSDVSGQSSGVAHLEHHRAYLDWLKELLRRFPTVVIENCSSGGQRMDYAMLSASTLQSTSDQQVPEAYAAIAAAVPTAVIPEQSATWAYPQKNWSDEINALTVVNSLLGRVHLSGRLDQLDSHQYDIVRSGMDVYKTIRHLLRNAHPFWPLGLPRWHDDWLSLGMRCGAEIMLVAVWRRKGATTCTLPLPGIEVASEVEVLYPRFPGTDVKIGDGTLMVSVPDKICARLIHINGRSQSCG